MAASILPLDFRFAESAVRDIAKLQSKSMDKPFKQRLSKCTQSTTTGRFITPMPLALSQADEMKATTGVDISITEQEPDFETGSLALIKRFPIYWSRLGSSKTRTHENGYEPHHDKTNKMSVYPAKTQISLGIRPV